MGVDIIASMRRFLVVGHTAPTDPGFTLDDLPGGAGRLDVLCRCVNSAFLLSHGLRRDVELYLVLLGPPSPPVTLKLVGAELKYLNPDERSTAALLAKALELDPGAEWQRSTPGIWRADVGLSKVLLALGDAAVLDAGGTPLQETVAHVPPGYVLSDHLPFSAEDEAALTGLPRVSVGPHQYHGHHVIAVVQNWWDRLEARVGA